jgi:predicted methyltransferase
MLYSPEAAVFIALASKSLHKAALLFEYSRMKKIIALALSATFISSALIQTVQATPAKKSTAPISDIAMDTILAADIRKDDKARDKYRHPKETLAFFQVKQGMTVVDYLPSSGWFTRILAPYLNGNGRYIGLNPNMNAPAFTDAQRTRINGLTEIFPATASGWTGLPAANFSAYTSNKWPAELNGTVDRVLIFREMHNLFQWNIADSEMKAIRDMLKVGGMVGITDHRAKPSGLYSDADGHLGYLREKDVINFMDISGFDLVGKSEINANPKDTKDYVDGVWTLPPNYRKKDVDHAKYEAIGESDRMTMLFRKRP